MAGFQESPMIETPHKTLMKPLHIFPRPLLLAAALLGTQADSARANADNFAAATEITGTSYNSGTFSILMYTAQAGEPGLQYGDTGAGKTAWWKWVAPEDGFCTADTLNQPDTSPVYDTLLGVYTGSQVDALTRVAANDDHWTNINLASFRGASCTFYALKGTTYYFALDGYTSASVSANAHMVRLQMALLPKRATRKLGAYRLDESMHGTVNVQKTSKFTITGKLTVGLKSYPLAGALTPEGFYTVAFPRTAPAGSPPLPPIGLVIDMKDNGEFHFTNGQGDWDSGKLQEAIIYGPGTSSTVAGTYAGSFPMGGTASTGLEFATVKANGTISGTVILPDGVKATFSGPETTLSGAYSSLPMCVPLHGGKGYMYQKLKFAELGQVDRMASDGNLAYVRPAAPNATFYKNGINSSGSVTGGTVVKPALNQRAMGFLDGTAGDGKLQIASVMGEISTVMEGLNFSTGNKFIFKTPAMRKPVLTVNKLTGQVTGSIYEPAGKKRTLIGALYKYNNQVYLRGQVTGTSQYASFEVIP